MEIELVYNELTGEFEEYKEPFRTVEFPTEDDYKRFTEEDYKRFEKILEFCREHHKEDDR